MKRKLALFLEFFLSKRLHIGLLAFLLVIYFMRCVGIDTYHPLTPFISFLILWAAYLENLTTDKKEDTLGQIPHGLFSFIESKLYPIEKFYPFVYLIAVALSLLVSIKCLLCVIATIIVFSSYVHRWIPSGKNKRRRAKEIFIIKNLIPPIGWVLSTQVIPFISSNSPFIPEYILFIMIGLICAFREEIKFDIPDTEGDRKAGIKTLPNLLGERDTKNILSNMQCIAAILFFVALLALKNNGRTLQFNSLLINMFPILAYFLYDHSFVNLLFEKRKKEYCNTGIVWLEILAILYLTIKYPFNIIIFLFLRVGGSLLVQLSNIITLFLNRLKNYLKPLFFSVGGD